MIDELDTMYVALVLLADCTPTFAKPRLLHLTAVLNKATVNGIHIHREGGVASCIGGWIPFTANNHII